MTTQIGTPQNDLRLGIVLDGADDPARAALAAEAAGFHLAVLGDPAARGGHARPLDAVQAAAWAAPRTRRIGIVAETEVVFPEPFHLATRLASLDLAAEGRAGWLVAAAVTPERAAAYDRAEPTPPEIRREVDDVIEVTRRLWDSWEDDAVIRDVATGRYLDGSKVHHVDFVGPTFSIAGPLITPRPPQGQLPVLAPWGLADPTAIDVAVLDTATGLDDLAGAAREARAAGVGQLLADLPVDLTSPASAAGLRRHLDALSHHVDLVLLRPTAYDDDLARLEHEVLPHLDLPAATGTLRDQLGLVRPASRYARPTEIPA